MSTTGAKGARPKHGSVALHEFVSGLRWEDVPDRPRARVLALVRDMAAVCAAGRATPVAPLGARYARGQHPGREATLWYDGATASAAGAAIANGLLANALDFDDGHRLVSGHPGAVVIPAALAVAEQANASREDTLAAIAIGYEVAIRAGQELHARSDPFYYQASGAWGSLGAAAAAARLLGLDARAIGHALGLAEYHAPIALVMRSAAEPAMTKDGCAWGAHVGVSSALLAGDGFTATSSLFAADRNAHVDLAIDWRVEEVYVKAFPCCRWTHAALEAARALTRRQRVQPDEIEHVNVRTFAAADELGKGVVTNTEEAQYSVVWPVAAALVHGDFGVEHAVEPGVGNPTVAGLQRRVELVLDPVLTAAYPERRYAEVTLALRGGKRLASGVFEPPGEPEDAQWDDVIAEKVARHAPWLAPGPPEAQGTPPGFAPFARLLGTTRSRAPGALARAFEQARE